MQSQRQVPGAGQLQSTVLWVSAALCSREEEESYLLVESLLSPPVHNTYPSTHSIFMDDHLLSCPQVVPLSPLRSAELGCTWSLQSAKLEVSILCPLLIREISTDPGQAAWLCMMNVAHS